MFRFLQKPLAQFISVVRAPKSKEGYASIGGGSPLRQITDAQARFSFMSFKKLLSFLSLAPRSSIIVFSSLNFLYIFSE